MRKVVVLGGYGTFGSQVSEALAAGQEETRLLIVGRDATRGRVFGQSLGVDFAQGNIHDHIFLASVLEDAFLAINTAGPFQHTDYHIPEACIRAGCHYLDIADGRAYVSGIDRLHAQAQEQSVFVCAGASAVPAITGAMVQALSKDLTNLKEIRAALSPGNKNPRGLSTVETILSFLGRPIRLMKDGKWVESFGWAESRVVNYPPPIGRRRVQLVDAPDLELFPDSFRAQTVTFKAGLELGFFNLSLGLLAWARRLVPEFDLTRFAKVFTQLSSLFYPLGTPQGALAVWISGENETGFVERCVALVVPRDGPRVPACPAILLARKLISEGIPRTGAYPCIGFLELEELSTYLATYGIFTVTGDRSGWRPGPS